MILYRCDFCGEIRESLQKNIEGREYDVCIECWRPLAEKLQGKGRAKRSRERVYLPPPSEPREEKPIPGEPPKIWASSERPN